MLTDPDAPLQNPPLPDTAPWLDAALAAARGGGGAVAVVGPARSGASGLAAALCRRLGPATLRAQGAGCRIEADLVRVLGAAAGLAARGDPSALTSFLAERPSLVVWIDEADEADDALLTDVLPSLIGPRALVLSGRRAPLGALVLPVPALPAPPAEPLPALNGTILAWAVLPRGLRGLPWPEGVPESWRHPHSASPRLTRWARERLAGEDLGAAVAPIQAALADRLEVARGGAWPSPPDERDLQALRWLCEVSPSPEVAALAAATAARALAAAGQLAQARELLGEARARGPGLSDQGLLAWAEGDVLLSFGLRDEAEDRHQDAVEALSAADSPALLGRLMRGAAQAHAAASMPRLAKARLEQARAVPNEGEAARRATARAAVELALAQGAVHEADRLLETLGPREDDPNDLLVRAGVRLAQGQLDAAEADLSQAQALALGAPELLAAAERRRVDWLLRSNRAEEAAAAAQACVHSLTALGQRAAAAAARRAWGDALALGGAWAEAESTYALALREHARVADLRGARRCLTRLCDLNRAGDDTARALELLVLLDAIDAEDRHDDATDTAR
jgi:tetratricopeptide (TPR) repeat protein